MIRTAANECLSRVVSAATVAMTLVAGVGAHVAVSPQTFGALEWRSVGPAVMGGRLDAVAGEPGKPYDGAPTRAQIGAIDRNQQQVTKVISELDHLQKVDVAKLNAQLKTAGLTVIKPIELVGQVDLEEVELDSPE